MNINHCPACGSESLGKTCALETVTFKGLEVNVPDISSTTCRNCGYTFATNKQHDTNVAAARTAFVQQRAAAKAAKGLLTGAQLRAMREALSLNQKEASELFGGGPVAFSKYENEDVSQSASMDRLVRVIHDMGAFGVKTLRAVLAKPVAEAVDPKSSHASAEIVVVTFNKRGKVGTTVEPQPSSGPAHELQSPSPMRLH